jgi:uncharacterized small protein (DUF1192 family)
MNIESQRQLENTRVKLLDLEQLHTKILQGAATNEHIRELTLRSLKKRINQFKEEIARFKAHMRPTALNG